MQIACLLKLAGQDRRHLRGAADARRAPEAIVQQAAKVAFVDPEEPVRAAEHNLCNRMQRYQLIHERHARRRRRGMHPYVLELP